MQLRSLLIDVSAERTWQVVSRGLHNTLRRVNLGSPPILRVLLPDDSNNDEAAKLHEGEHRARVNAKVHMDRTHQISIDVRREVRGARPDLVGWKHVLAKCTGVGPPAQKIVAPGLLRLFGI